MHPASAIGADITHPRATFMTTFVSVGWSSRCSSTSKCLTTPQYANLICAAFPAS